ncbi:bacteriorhodopsin [Spirosoma radiotolerans]|uniref:Rhodopsin n=1 Tax=Spirosoma radiotolerans TaxID=1379870 RepID=A0A0E3ZSD4_9BACT|nr:bacteriorhodopsin [Spirosoma radiotolerans]AKD54078.1 hypothetical protein SD10_03350 [Spirosoma radiotolerans]
MEIADSFVPTAGVVGVFPLVTYFLLIVATYSFLGTFIFALASRPGIPLHQAQNLAPLLTAIVAAISGLSYYRIQGYYHDLLADLVTVANPSDRQVLIRESYNAIGQFRYMDWAITIPLLLIQVALVTKLQPAIRTQILTRLVAGSFFMVLTSYIGHQQLAFDNEIQVGPKLVWGAIAMLGYGVVLHTLVKLWKQLISQAQPDLSFKYRQIAYALGILGVIYPLGYFLTCTAIDFNWIHIAYTIADVSTKIGIGLIISFAPLTVNPTNE